MTDAYQDIDLDTWSRTFLSTELQLQENRIHDAYESSVTTGEPVPIPPQRYPICRDHPMIDHPDERGRRPAVAERRSVPGDRDRITIAWPRRPPAWRQLLAGRRLILPRLPASASALLVLRVFIGLGWLRAFAEKAPDSAWRDGAAVAAFLDERMARGEVAVPPYETLIVGVFLPLAPALGWLIMAGQLLVGMALLTGTLTRAALLGGLVMNVNFLLAGAPNPSGFYIVIQAALLATGAGSILSVDAWRTRGASRSAAVLPGNRRWRIVAAGLGLAVTGYALMQARDLSPAGSVHDPAVLLAVLGGLAALWAILTDGTPADQQRGGQGDHTLRSAQQRRTCMHAATGHLTHLLKENQQCSHGRTSNPPRLEIRTPR